MTTYRSAKGNFKEESSNWLRIGLLGKRNRSRAGGSFIQPNTSSSSFVDNSYQSQPPDLRHPPSDNHLYGQYNGAPPPTPQSAVSAPIATLRPYSAIDRKPYNSTMAGMLDIDRARSRRDRTFIGNQCAVCEEPLEHTLRGERILQFSCGHVSHEACFYEYIKEVDSQTCPECNAPLGLDASRGGNVLDIEKLSSIVRSVSVAEGRESRDRERERGSEREREREREADREREQEQERERDAALSPRWESQTMQSVPTIRTRQGSRTSSLHPERERDRESREVIRDSRDGRDGHDSRSDLRSETRDPPGHWRSLSGTSAGDFPEAAPGQGTTRKHDYDIHSIESDLGRHTPPTNPSSNPIPPPIVVVKSEFPTITRSKGQQSLTCLVTVEVAERKWQAPTDELPPPPMAPPPPPPVQSVPLLPPTYDLPPSPSSKVLYSSYEKQERENRERLDQIMEDLSVRVDNWHGLDFNKFGKLRLHGTIKVGKDCQSWQELECFLFSEMLICVKEKKVSSQNPQWSNGQQRQKAVKCTLKGSILIKKHLKKVHDSSSTGEHILTLSLSVAELPQFHLLFMNHVQLEQWHRALLDLHATESAPARPHHPSSDVEEEDFRTTKTTRRLSSTTSSYGGGSRSIITSPTEYSTSAKGFPKKPMISNCHIPLDIVVVIPVSSSMQGLKINLLRDTLKFMVHSLGDRDRMGLVTFGSSGGGVPLVSLTGKSWNGWSKVIQSIRPVGTKSLRADVVEGANVAMDLLMQRKLANPIASILLISDASTSETKVVDFVVSRAEAAKITIHSFGLGLTHKPDTMIELSTRTKATYTYVKDWMMLRECIAGCIGSLQSSSHQNAKVKLKLPEGSPARFVKISGALHISKRASGREAEASLGDLRFGDKKDILVQLVVTPDNSSDTAPQDAWESIVSGLEALGGVTEQDEQRVVSVEEVPLIQADLTWGDIQREGSLSQLSRPHLLTITMLPATPAKKSQGRPPTPPIPSHPSVVQRRMELLTSDMLTRALTLVSHGQHDRAQTLLVETRTILRGLGKGGLPPVPPSPQPSIPEEGSGSQGVTPSSPLELNFTPANGIDPATVSALDAELEAALEWINHPAVFARDSRKAILQTIGVISCQRAITFRTACESLWAGRIAGVKGLSIQAREWRDAEQSLMEED